MAAALREDLKPYLTASFATHLCLLGGALLFVGRAPAVPRMPKLW